IYIHIPFCKQACNYCNFHFSTSQRNVEELVNCLEKEILIRASSHHKDIGIIEKDEPIQTIYFGGGTPSLLPASAIERLLNVINQNYNVPSDAEITLEANPDDLDKHKLQDLKSAGINRLSIGVQSFDEKDLVWMNRAHNATQASQCIEWAQSAGFTNLSIDLIFGLPEMDDNRWLKNIIAAINTQVAHMACYALTVEPKTPLQKLIRLNKKEPVNNERQAAQFSILMQTMSAAGYEHYEISNFAKPGYRSKHNSSYWQGKKYIGIGPSAHSYNGDQRMWNVANNAAYIRSIQEGSIPFEEETLTIQQKLNEEILTSIRTSEGIDIKKITALYNLERAQQVMQNLQGVNSGHYTLKDDHIILTDAGKLFGDAISVQLFL
ncbi:MAG: radical SAM family heme chaperone HemW, partial [Ginsengibacter sp.]